MSETVRPRLRTLFPLAASYGFFLLALSVDILLLYDVGLLAEGPPIFDTIYLLRTALIALSSGLLVFGLAAGWHKDSDPAKDLKVEGREPISASADGSGTYFSKKIKKYILWGLIILAAGFLLLFLTDAHAFYQLRKEDNILEVCSALVWFFDALVFFRAAIRLFPVRDKVHRLVYLIPLILGLASFLVSMEEISWFQRVFSLDTPDFIVENVREEINFHNYATDEVENVYYLSTFLAFIFLPFVAQRLDFHRVPPWVRVFIPCKFVVLASSLAIAYNYDMWNILFTQLSFFITVFILLIMIKEAYRNGQMPISMITLVGIICLSQGLFLIFGDRFVRPWDVTEYKEFFIPLGVILYSLDLSPRVKVAANSQTSNALRRV